MTSRNYKLNRRVVLSISILLIISSILAIGWILSQTRKQKEAASKFQLEQSIQKVNNEFGSYFTPIDNALVLFAEWGKTGLFEDRKEENIVAKFLPFLDQFDDIEYISIASEDGYFIALNRSKHPIETKQINSGIDSIWTLKHWNRDLEQVGYSVSEFLPRNGLPCICFGISRLARFKSVGPKSIKLIRRSLWLGLNLIFLRSFLGTCTINADLVPLS